MYLSNCTPTPPLTQQQSNDNKSGIMLGQGRGRWAVAQILILIWNTRISNFADIQFKNKSRSCSSQDTMITRLCLLDFVNTCSTYSAVDNLLIIRKLLNILAPKAEYQHDVDVHLCMSTYPFYCPHSVYVLPVLFLTFNKQGEFLHISNTYRNVIWSLLWVQIFFLIWNLSIHIDFNFCFVFHACVCVFFFLFSVEAIIFILKEIKTY